MIRSTLDCISLDTVRFMCEIESAVFKTTVKIAECLAGRKQEAIGQKGLLLSLDRCKTEQQNLEFSPTIPLSETSVANCF